MTRWVQRLLVANIIVFFVQMTMPSITDGFVFIPAAILVRPWTLVTYMFLHSGLTHILFNMMGLYFFGPQVESRIGSSRFATLYFTSGITGALLSFLFAPYSPIVGASAGVFGVMLAFAMFWPRAQILIWGIIPVEARWLVVITTVLALWSGLGGSRGGVADFAHLGGYLGAWLYLKWIGRNPALAKFQKKAAGPAKVIELANWKAVNRDKVHEVNRAEVDRILDKISAQGIGSLTPQEMAFLQAFVPKDDVGLKQ